MATLRNRALAACFVALASAAGGSGCYKPAIQDGGLRCTAAGACPEGFHCAGDGVCHEGAAMMCQPDAAMIEPLCPPEPGSDCDPICQTRCQCGRRCNLVGASLTCVLTGNKQRGDICNLGNDDCAPGNTCVADCGNIGRCYRFCGKGSVRHAELCAGQTCDFMLSDRNGNSTELVACQPPFQACNPVGDNADCGNEAIGCYVTPGGQPTCDCRGTAASGGACGPYNSCIPGFRCVSLAGAPRCFKTCRLSSASDCTAPSTCTSLQGSITFGYCP